MLATARSQQRLFNLVIVLVLCAGAFLAIAPMLYMVSTAFKAKAYVQEIPPHFLPENPTLENFQAALTSRNFGRAFLNSAFVAISTMFLVTLLASMMAYASSQYFPKNAQDIRCFWPQVTHVGPSDV